MPPKREKDKDGDTIKQTIDLVDYELFLQAYDSEYSKCMIIF